MQKMIEVALVEKLLALISLLNVGEPVDERHDLWDAVYVVTFRWLPADD